MSRADVVKHFDSNHDGSVDLEEFKELYSKCAAAVQKRNLKADVEKKADAAQKARDTHAASPLDLQVCEQVFNKLDKNGNGTIDGAELKELAAWAWGSFHPGADPADAWRHEMDMVKHFDANRDGSVDLEEFKELYAKCAAAVQKRNLKADKTKASHARRKARKVPPLSALDMKVCEDMFGKLDKSGNGTIDGKELQELAAWAWGSFHPGK